MSSQTRIEDLSPTPSPKRPQATICYAPVPPHAFRRSAHNPPRRSPLTCVLALLVAAVITVGTTSFFFPGAAETEHYATHLGGKMSVRLKDGSVMTLNTSTIVDSRIDGENWSVQILQGEVHFNMVPNPHRHLVVSAADQFTVRDIGTVFDVRLNEQGGGQVTVKEGEVELSIPQGASIRLRQNQQATLDSDSSHLSVQARNVAPKEIERELAWLRGHLSFDCTTLADAANEFNRYNLTQIEVMDEIAGKVQIGGVFSNSEPDIFAREITKLSDNIRLSSIEGPAHTHILQLSTRNAKIPTPPGCTAQPWAE